MTANEYYKKLAEETGKILETSLLEAPIQSACTDLKSNLMDWYMIVVEKNEPASLLIHAIEQLDISCLQLMQGLYRSSFASLRLSLEMICGSIYYAAHDMEFKEWSNGAKDLIWSQLSDEDNGIFSKRFAHAYFPEISSTTPPYLIRLKKLYRELSEMVHGNNKTWDYEKPELSYNELYRSSYLEHIKTLSIITNYGFC